MAGGAQERVDDAADAMVRLVKHYSGDSHVNVGVGTDTTIAELAQLLADVVGFEGTLTYDRSMPDGTPRKLLDISLLRRLDWQAKIGLREGLKQTYSWYLTHCA